MKQRIWKRHPYLATMETLNVMIQEEWDLIIPEELTTLVDSIPTPVCEVGLSYSRASQSPTPTGW